MNIKSINNREILNKYLYILTNKKPIYMSASFNKEYIPIRTRYKPELYNKIIILLIYLLFI